MNYFLKCQQNLIKNTENPIDSLLCRSFFTQAKLLGSFSFCLPACYSGVWQTEELQDILNYKDIDGQASICYNLRRKTQL